MKKILVIDRIKSIEHYYRYALSKLPISVIYLSKFDSVLFTLSADAIDAIIVDPVNRKRGRLDIEEGLELIRKIKKIHPDIPVIAHSALDTLNGQFKAYQSFPDIYLIKSIDESELISNIVKLLDLEADLIETLSFSPRLKAKIFISYAKEDFPKAYAIYEILTQKEFCPWIDSENLLPGQDWELEIEKAIGKCNFFIACLSKASVNKEGYVQKELRMALDILYTKPEGAIYLIPVRLDTCQVPKRLEGLQWCTLTEKRGIDKLVRAIELASRERGLIP